MTYTNQLIWAGFLKQAVSPTGAAISNLLMGPPGPMLATAFDNHAGVSDVLRSGGRTIAEGAAGLGLGALPGALAKNPYAAAGGGLLGAIAGSTHGANAAAKSFNERHSLLAKLKAMLGQQ